MAKSGSFRAATRKVRNPSIKATVAKARGQRTARLFQKGMGKRGGAAPAGGT